MNDVRDKISVLLVDDHAVVRAGYKTFLQLADLVGQVHEADDGKSACQAYQTYRPDVVILDLSMPGIGGLETIRRLLAYDALCKILVFSMHNEAVFINRALQAGAKGYIDKSSAPETLVNALYRVAQGELFMADSLADTLPDHADEDTDTLRLNLLSPREFEVFCLLASGLTSKDAAEKLFLSNKTICNHATSIKEKLAVKSVAELTLMAARLGLITTQL